MSCDPVCDGVSFFRKTGLLLFGFCCKINKNMAFRCGIQWHEVIV